PMALSKEETKEVKTENSSAVAIPDFVKGFDRFEDVLKCYGVKITDDKPSLDESKPLLGKYIIKSDLEVNGKILCDSIPSGGTSSGGNNFFTLKESDQLYLYRPSKVYEESNYYCMRWDIDKNYDLPLNMVFKFRDYLFGQYWELKWDGKNWTGNNCQNMCPIKISTYPEDNLGTPEFIIMHTDKIAKWMKETVYPDMPDDHSKLYFTEILFPYLTNWRVVKKDGTEISDGITASYNTSTSGKYTINNIKYDKIRLGVSAPNGLGKQDGLYVKVDLNINDNITEIKWDCHPNQCVEAGYLITFGSNPCLELFRSHREKRHSIKVIEGFNHKNIRLYIEKEFFEFEVKVNPFDIILQKQFYEVEPDPRKCTTITTDYNIYSSKIIWADNIMTMRRDLNIIGGISDVLAYDFALLKQTVNNLVEQMRLQAEYNKWVASVQKVLSITNTILTLTQLGFSIAGALSTLNMENNSLRINTYQTSPFPGPGGSGGGGFPGDGGSGFQGKFLKR
ncbi:hypothetical protein M9Y10_004652, partial [Tritrichomonas musculus]